MPYTSHVINAGEGTSLSILTDQVRVLATSNQTNERYEVFEVSGPRDSGPPPHCHAWGEAYFVLEGEVDVCMGDQAVTAGPGAYVQCEGGAVHSFRIRSEGARMLVITDRRGASEFFHDMAKVAPAVPCDMEAAIKVAAQHGVRIGG